MSWPPRAPGSELSGSAGKSGLAGRGRGILFPARSALLPHGSEKMIFHCRCTMFACLHFSDPQLYSSLNRDTAEPMEKFIRK